MLSLLVVDSSFFSHGMEVYLQAKDLPMGNKLSKMLAEITTNFFTVVRLMADTDITFVYKFVDGFASAMDPLVYMTFCSKAVGDIGTLQLKKVDENDDGVITFLDILLKRNDVMGLTTR